MNLREDQIIKLISATIRDRSALEIIPKIGLKTVFAVSKIFPDLNLSKESLWVVGYLDQPAAFALTNKSLMVFIDEQIKTAAIMDQKSIEEVLNRSELSATLKEDILQLVLKLNVSEQPLSSEKETSPLKDKSFDDFITKMKELGQIIEDKAAKVVNNRQKETPSQPTENPKKETEKQSGVVKDFVLDTDFLDFLQEEGNKLYEIIEDLKSDKAFLSALHSSLSNSEFLSDEFGVEHVMLQDIIWIYNLCDGEKSTLKEIKAKYSLAYLFERLQGKDMIDMLPIERINEMVQKEKFNESIEKLKQANFLKLPAE